MHLLGSSFGRKHFISKNHEQLTLIHCNDYNENKRLKVVITPFLCVQKGFFAYYEMLAKPTRR